MQATYIVKLPSLAHYKMDATSEHWHVMYTQRN